ncbi:hypothetical protein QR680_007709 [Steinernema hermaphroditum]|uniref:PDZ domain-containing protein n=1 Tax=Steinernema hermaphroditum TaxID=289476 RepID=A0AA39IGG9_9BILA|nr:hypothetical protein QR680_007709 [Steinernema hermaphroditum]
MTALRSSQLEVLLEGEWHRFNATLDETALTLAPVDEGPGGDDWGTTEKRTVRVVKNEGSGLGISIKGGRDNNMPILISKIFKNMAADLTGQLFVGDAILAVNGESLVDASHDEAVRALKKAGRIVDLQGKLLSLNRPGIRYMRDIYMSKDSIFGRIQWDEDGIYQKDGAVRSIGLKLACVTRTSLEMEDIENRTFEIRSPSARYVLTFRGMNSVEADIWFENIHACADTLLTQALAQVNLMLGQNPQVRRMGWLAEQSVQHGVLVWKPVFAALTMNDLLFYDAVPLIKSEWANPKITRPLIATRVVQTTARTCPVISGLSDIISFTTRTGTQQGIRSHLFRVETHRELAAWVKFIVHCTYEACTETAQISAPCIWQNQQCELIFQLDKGISLVGQQTRQILWQYPFEVIRATGDDGQQFLWIDFGPPAGEQEMDLLGSPKPVVFILHSFLATKVYHLGLYA